MVKGKSKAEKERDERRRQRFWKYAVSIVERWLRAKFDFSHDDFDPGAIDGPVLVAINHASAYDPIFVGVAFRKKRLTYIASEHILFAENGLCVAYECRMPMPDPVILAATRRHIGELFSLHALDLLSVSEENYRALTEIYPLCATSLQQEILAEILARKYADAHAAALFELFSASRYPKTRLQAVELGLRFGFDLATLQKDPDGHVRKAALGHFAKK